MQSDTVPFGWAPLYRFLSGEDTADDAVSRFVMFTLKHLETCKIL